MITLKPMHGDSLLPDWLERGVESSLRDTEDDMPAPPPPTNFSSGPLSQKARSLASPVVLTPSGGSPSGGSKLQLTDLDKFYEEGQDESDGDEGEEQENTSTTESSEDVSEDSDSEDIHSI